MRKILRYTIRLILTPVLGVALLVMWLMGDI